MYNNLRPGYLDVAFLDTDDGLLERVILALGAMLEDETAVDIITFCESPDFLGQRLYPRQKLILKVYYKVDLESYPCWCTADGKLPDLDCELCHGTGVYDELQDCRYLLSGVNQYANMCFPGLCSHHAEGVPCEVPGHNTQKNYRRLTDDELRYALKTHRGNILEVIAGRRSGKSALGAFVNSYELYKLLRVPNPQRNWMLLPGQDMGTANVAVDEEQAKILFNQMKNLIIASKWFQKTRYRLLETQLEFVGRGVQAKSLHSNSSSVRGKTLIAVFLDEFCHFNRTAGKLSDKAMWAALVPSTITFGEESRIVITSSPLNKSGQAWDLYEAAYRGTLENVLVFTFSTWEMNPRYDRWTGLVADEYVLDADYAETEYGAQWSESVGHVIPDEAVDACVDSNLSQRMEGERGIKYTIHVDNAKTHDSCAVVICHYDKGTGKVIFDLINEFSPTDEFSLITENKEIDQQKLAEYVVALQKRNNFTFNSVTTDQFNSAWLIQELRRHFREDLVEEIFVSDKVNREVFLNLRALFVQSQTKMYYHNEAVKQLKTLAKIVKKSGAVHYAAPPRMKDDIVNAMAMAAYRCLELALGTTSRIHITGTSQDAIDSIEKKKTGGWDKTGHHPECTPQYCHYLCQINRQRNAGEVN